MSNNLLTADERHALEPVIAHEIRRLRPFADVDHEHAPAALRGGMTSKNWAASTDDARLGVLTQSVRAQVFAREVERKPAPLAGAYAAGTSRPAARAVSTAPEVAAAPPAVAPATGADVVVWRWTVPCARGYGRVFPARGPRAVVRLCPPCAKKVAARRRPAREADED